MIQTTPVGDRLLTAYYNVATFFTTRVDRVRRRGAEAGVMTTMEIAVWTVAGLAIATAAFFIVKGAITKQTDVIQNQVPLN